MRREEAAWLEREQTFELGDKDLVPTLSAFERSDSCPDIFSGVA